MKKVRKKINMEKETKILIIIVSIATIYLISFGIWTFYINNTSQKEIVECISQEAILYSRSECSFCLIQEEKFGKNVNLLRGIDCSVESKLCFDEGIKVTPTWILNNGTQLKGVYSIGELRRILGC